MPCPRWHRNPRLGGYRSELGSNSADEQKSLDTESSGSADQSARPEIPSSFGPGGSGLLEWPSSNQRALSIRDSSHLQTEPVAQSSQVSLRRVAEIIMANTSAEPHDANRATCEQ